MSNLDLLVRLMTAALLGGAIGLERHRSDKAAGLRTHMMVSLGSALIMIVSAHGFDSVLQPTRIVLDPARVAAQVVSGIGFLGAGAILRRNDAVLGLTTAASIWAVAALGLAAGAGLYAAAIVSTLTILLILTALRWVEDRVAVKSPLCLLSITVQSQEVASKVVESALVGHGLDLLEIRVRRGEHATDRLIEATLARAAEHTLMPLVSQLQATEGVSDVRYEGRPW